MIHQKFMIMFAVFMTAFGVVFSARTIADGHYFLGAIFVLMSFGGINLACCMWDEMKEEREEKRRRH